MLRRFPETEISYRSTADNGYQWDVRYALRADADSVTAEIRIDLVGTDPGARQAVWANGMAGIWNQQAFFFDGTRLLPIEIDFDFVSSSQSPHQAVTVIPGPARGDMLTWPLENFWPRSFDGAWAAHESGHMFDVPDEYHGGATRGGYVTTGTLMADLSPAIQPYYFHSLAYHAERLGGEALTIRAALRGTDRGERLSGGSDVDGLYGFGGADTLFGRGGNDWLSGGLGHDRLSGGAGRDTFAFATAADAGIGSSCDVILDFDHGRDVISLSQIDASTVLKGNSAFCFVGTSPIGRDAGGALRYVYSGDATVVFGDTDADAAPEFQIALAGRFTLSADDFFL